MSSPSTSSPEPGAAAARRCAPAAPERPGPGKDLLIGTLSRLTGASPKAIRLYEELGLLGRVSRRGAYRIYSEHHVGQVRLVKQAQALGLRLSELEPLLNARTGEPDWQQALRLLEAKRAAVGAEIERLRQLDAQLGRVTAELQQCLAQSRDIGAAGCEAAAGPAAASGRPRAPA